MQIFFRGIIGLVVFAFLLFFLEDAFVTTDTDQIKAPLALASAAIVGTLTCYPNNVGRQVPYLVYQEPSGAATKAIVFNSASSCETKSGTFPCELISDALPTYYGASAVVARGTIDDGDLLIDTLNLSPAPL